MYFITFFERVLGEEKLFPKKIGDKCSTGNIVFPENLAFYGLFRGEFYKNSYALILPLFPEKINTFLFSKWILSERPMMFPFGDLLSALLDF